MEVKGRDLPGGGKWVRLVGSMGVGGAGIAKEPLALVADEHDRILIELTDVDYISSVGVGVLLSTAQEVDSRGGKVVICSPTDTVLDTLRLMKIDAISQIFPTNEEGLAALQS